MTALQAIVLDFDGVIADSERLHMKAFQQALVGTPITLSAEAYYAHYLGFDDHGAFRAIFRDQGQGLDPATLDRLVAVKGDLFETLSAAGELLFPGVAAFIEAAAAAVPMAIASGAQTHEIEHVLAEAGLRGRFLAVVGADQTAASKPAPDPYLEAVARLRHASGLALESARVVAVEDSRWGLESARAAGLRTVAVTTSYPADALTAHADLVVAGLHALHLDVLDRLCGPA